MAIDSIPPDAKEDPHGANRYGLREGLVLTAEAGERGRSSFRTAEKAAGKSCVPFSFVSRDRERLLLPGIELAVAGLSFGLARQKTGMRCTEWAAASRFWVDRRRVRPNPAVWDRATGVITGKAGRCWRRLCRNRRTRGHDPHKVFSASDHGHISHIYSHCTRRDPLWFSEKGPHDLWAGDSLAFCMAHLHQSFVSEPGLDNVCHLAGLFFEFFEAFLVAIGVGPAGK